MPIDHIDDVKNAMGGTELQKFALADRLSKSLLEPFQIIPSRNRGFDSSKFPVYWAHDLPGDPECDHLKNGGYNLYEKLVFVSNWQMQQFIAYYGIPWYKCIVIENAIEPIAAIDKPTDKIKLIYHTTPHRGLEILVPVFEKLCEKYDNIELDVYSSFKIYGWEQRDEQYQELFDRCKAHPKINYHGTVSNTEVKEALGQAHIFAYPSIWLETSCISLMEAMSAGCVCVHPNYGALYETAGGMTMMYQWQQNKQDHAKMFYSYLDFAIQNINHESTQTSVGAQRAYANSRYNWATRTYEWRNFLEGILTSKGYSVDSDEQV